MWDCTNVGTEEMVYIMLDKESQTKGKAAVDVVGCQTGKAFSSCLQQARALYGVYGFTAINNYFKG